MTQGELEEVRTMTAREVVKKYLPLLVRGTIERKVYDWLLSQAKDGLTQEDMPRTDELFRPKDS